MHAPKYIEKNLDLEKYRERCQEMHSKKLGELQKPGDVKKLAKTVEEELERKRKEKLKTHEFNNLEKNILINRDNQVLLNKLVEISKGKWSSIQAPKKPVAETLPGPKSLNIGVRKIQNDKIERENHAFAKRLFDKSGCLSKNKMDEEYMNHLKYRKQIQKIKKKNEKFIYRMPKTNGRTGLLPPIESGQQSKRVQSVGGNENRQQEDLTSSQQQRASIDTNNQAAVNITQVNSKIQQVAQTERQNDDQSNDTLKQ
eukprot:403339081